MGEVRQMKSSLRHEVKAIVGKISAENRQRQSSIIVQKVMSHPLIAGSSRVSVFISSPTEPDTSPIVKWLLNSNKDVFVPRFKRGATLMEMVKLYSIKDFNELPEVMWGIRQPPIAQIRESALDTGLDVVIMPGCAFTPNGKRLGFGKGYYDRFMAHYKNQFGSFPYLIGIGFEEQIVDDLPTTELDVPLNEVLTSN